MENVNFKPMVIGSQNTVLKNNILLTYDKFETSANKFCDLFKEYIGRPIDLEEFMSIIKSNASAQILVKLYALENDLIPEHFDFNKMFESGVLKIPESKELLTAIEAVKNSMPAGKELVYSIEKLWESELNMFAMNDDFFDSADSATVVETKNQDQNDILLALEQVSAGINKLFQYGYCGVNSNWTLKKYFDRVLRFAVRDVKRGKIFCEPNPNIGKDISNFALKKKPNNVLINDDDFERTNDISLDIKADIINSAFVVGLNKDRKFSDNIIIELLNNASKDNAVKLLKHIYPKRRQRILSHLGSKIGFDKFYELFIKLKNTPLPNESPGDVFQDLGENVRKDFFKYLGENYDTSKIEVIFNEVEPDILKSLGYKKSNPSNKQATIPMSPIEVIKKFFPDLIREEVKDENDNSEDKVKPETSNKEKQEALN